MEQDDGLLMTILCG